MERVVPAKKKTVRNHGLTTQDVKHWISTKVYAHPELQLVYSVARISIEEGSNPLDTTIYGIEKYSKPYSDLKEYLSDIDFPALRKEQDSSVETTTGKLILDYDGLYHKRTMNRKWIEQSKKSGGANKTFSVRDFVIRQFMKGNNKSHSEKTLELKFQDDVGDLCTKASLATKNCCKELLSSLVVTAFNDVAMSVKSKKSDPMLDFNEPASNLALVRRKAGNNFTCAIILYHVNELITNLCQDNVSSMMLVNWVCKASSIILSTNDGSKQYNYSTTGSDKKNSGIKQLLTDASNEIQLANTKKVMTCINKENKSVNLNDAGNLFSFASSNLNDNTNVTWTDNYSGDSGAFTDNNQGNSFPSFQNQDLIGYHHDQKVIANNGSYFNNTSKVPTNGPLVNNTTTQPGNTEHGTTLQCGMNVGTTIPPSVAPQRGTTLSTTVPTPLSEPGTTTLEHGTIRGGSTIPIAATTTALELGTTRGTTIRTTIPPATLDTSELGTTLGTTIVPTAMGTTISTTISTTTPTPGVLESGTTVVAHGTDLNSNGTNTSEVLPAYMKRKGLFIFPIPKEKGRSSNNRKENATTKTKRKPKKGSTKNAKKSKTNATIKTNKKQQSDFVAPSTIRKFFPGYGWYSGTVGSITKHDTYVVTFEDGDAEEYQESDLEELMELEKLAIGEVGYQFLREYGGMFYSGNVESINDDGTRECYVTDRLFHDYSLEQLNDWKDLKNSDDNKVKFL